MNHNTLQNNQNNSTFTEFSNLQSTVIQPIQPGHSLNINYNDVNVNSSVNNFPTSYYTNTHYLDQQPTSNENISTPIASSYAPQYVGPQQTIENIPSPLGPFNMINIDPSQSQILSFDIPGFKIIVIPTSPQQDNTYLNYSSQSQQ
ncbi:hypothetical protein RhiirA5_428972 [Rhizophagus irregularis]|uniref:Uncharacterized protein n=1 Tax=Rhizophagus irregularis TaxID=588596 RepID=A0A2N0NZA6_9GLOM|nr:hypothetical protein RhiirA5_428972 [Rhizophagus irregularis]PKC55970.1 hypothetical protein RhiirA1_402484 [Rhizophagus irregularis]CAB4491094.1 unnamed protein product [Rhizophagus irregularis]